MRNWRRSRPEPRAGPSGAQVIPVAPRAPPRPGTRPHGRFRRCDFVAEPHGFTGIRPGFGAGCATFPANRECTIDAAAVLLELLGMKRDGGVHVSALWANASDDQGISGGMVRVVFPLPHGVAVMRPGRAVLIRGGGSRHRSGSAFPAVLAPTGGASHRTRRLGAPGPDHLTGSAVRAALAASPWFATDPGTICTTSRCATRTGGAGRVFPAASSRRAADSFNPGSGASARTLQIA